MKKICMTLAAVCYALSVCAQDNKRIAPSTLSEGDLLFCVAESDNNITDVTTGLEGKRIDHVAIFHRKDGQGFALEAIHKGVCLSPIDSFMTRRQNVMVAQLKDTMGVACSVERALRFIGTPYDFNFMPSDSAMYCSELVQKCYKTKEGNLVFKPIPMSFHDKTGAITPYWKDYYGRQGLRVPEGEPGSNPGDLSRSDKIFILGELRKNL
ncbi:YiiX/YebB-like N1pC/P60 family cysteine hydrolase [Hallella sp.]|uniref:YiiX/YebB-like N1pC/P60 family cysteine hydrolase n=1 Tax=Hallella sp. TaxID=2980186 RepID=UPI00258D8DD9|nr:YiiX/YebB-like N1pC/P60 family cysteine hydrolase [Hallella sp.]MBS7400818.1 hypothetical protein [Prevotella sp.]MDY6021367.1 YiiX/YebB-like N1pC/P60 family cysteine hydrolase [Sodaliphilus sp.]MCI7433105.1 hypothetical protein [Prevotella sp.]MDD7145490.1 YiiX/YebB-like N1pC/P60 family cysteine hydrolase [Hallella sp.]MDY5926240.1 YiiX/YebB-like N1pC/P60 family cysteine hydrolase [Hallella sp.]